MILALSFAAFFSVVLLTYAALLPFRAAIQSRRTILLNRLSTGRSAEQAVIEKPDLQVQGERKIFRAFRLLIPSVSYDVLSEVKLAKVVIWALIGFVATAAVALGRMDLSFHITLVLSGLVAGLVALFQVRRHAAKREEEIAESVVEFLDMVVRALRVGFPVATALVHASEELKGPLAKELSITNERVSFGQDMAPALYELSSRTKNADLQFFASAVSIQMQTGGNLAEVLENLAKIGRERRQLRRKITSITAEAKWSARFLSAFPLLAVVAINFMSPGYFDILYESDLFIPIVSTVGLLIVVNMIFMRWLTDLE